MSDNTKQEPTRARLWNLIAAQLRFLRNTDFRPVVDELRPVVEWVIMNPELFQVVRAAHKAKVDIAQALEASMDAKAEHAAALAELQRKVAADAPNAQAS